MAERTPLVAIVIVAYKDWESLRACIHSIEAGSYSNRRILVIDNSPGDDLERRMTGFPDVEYRRPGRNLGFTRAVNLGMARSLELKADMTLVLNPDTELEASCLGELVSACLSSERTGIVCGRIHFKSSPERIWYAGGRMSWIEGVGKHFRAESAPPSGSGAIEVSYATGCCMLIPNRVLGEVGLLNPSIFMYLDDAEFCMRVLRAGYRIYYAPGARLSHAVGPGRKFTGYPPYYLYFSIRNKPFVAGPGPYRGWLKVHALMLAAAKLAIYGLAPGVGDRAGKLRAIAFGAWDSLSAESREERRFPRLFRA